MCLMRIGFSEGSMLRPLLTASHRIRVPWAYQKKFDHSSNEAAVLVRGLKAPCASDSIRFRFRWCGRVVLRCLVASSSSHC